MIFDGIYEPYDLWQDEINACQQFALACSDNYDKRGQKNKQKVREDKFIGKMGELIAYYRLRDHLCELSYPSFEIFDKRHKSWLSDMSAGSLDIACKTCRRQNDPSWIFQLSDDTGHGRDKEIFDEATDDKLVAFIQMNYPLQDQSEPAETISGSIMALAPLSQLRAKELFWDPRKEDLGGYKRAVYLFPLNFNKFAKPEIHQSVHDLIERVQA